MKTLLRLATSTLSAAAVLLAAGCGPKTDHAGHDHDHDHDAAGGSHHVHVAPHGGTLIEVGEHQFNLELQHDAAAGRLTVWLLDAHAENFVRQSGGAPLDLVVVTPAGEVPLQLQPVANAATGETAGDTSQFEVTADVLRTPGPLAGRVPALTLRGQRFEGLDFSLPPAVR